jgi:hypothetical protein
MIQINEVDGIKFRYFETAMDVTLEMLEASEDAIGKFPENAGNQYGWDDLSYQSLIDPTKAKISKPVWDYIEKYVSFWADVSMEDLQRFETSAIWTYWMTHNQMLWHAMKDAEKAKGLTFPHDGVLYVVPNIDKEVRFGQFRDQMHLRQIAGDNQWKQARHLLAAGVWKAGDKEYDDAGTMARVEAFKTVKFPFAYQYAFFLGRLTNRYQNVIRTFSAMQAAGQEKAGKN